jgi:hypothetical protein
MPGVRGIMRVDPRDFLPLDRAPSTGPPRPGPLAYAPVAGSSTKTGISRSVFFW